MHSLRIQNRYSVAALMLLLMGIQIGLSGQQIDGSLKIWQRVTLTFDGPFASEAGAPNPFSDYHLEVTFSSDKNVYVVQGFFAADGNASESGAQEGNKWRVHFTPDATGEWNYLVRFRSGLDVAIDQSAPGKTIAPNGLQGQFTVWSDENTRKGRLQYVGKRYLQYAGSKEFFLKTGADAPETLLAYADFDSTYVHGGNQVLKSWAPHFQDWRAGDPVWRDSLGKGIIGAINYLHDVGQNVFSFLTMNINGDGKNVWPYVRHSQRDRFDCSKLDQWEIVFQHADTMGMYLHFKTQETENDQLLDGGTLGRERKLYYRELVARFGHHLALNWNVGEENTNSDAERKAFAQYLSALDPYDHNIVVHTFPNGDDEVYTPLLGDSSSYTGASLQVVYLLVHQRTLEWIRKSQESGKPWVVANDEQGGAQTGVPHDNYNGSPTLDDIRKMVLWGHLMAGGAGVEYYFGYNLPHSDLTCEDFRSRSVMWGYNRIAREFFENHIPFWRMENHNALVGNEQDGNSVYCLADPGETYLVYTFNGTDRSLDLQSHLDTFDIYWFDPRNGGKLLRGTKDRIAGGGSHVLGDAPYAQNQDWAILITRQTNFNGFRDINFAPVDCADVRLYWTIDDPDIAHFGIERNIDDDFIEIGEVDAGNADGRFNYLISGLKEEFSEWRIVGYDTFGNSILSDAKIYSLPCEVEEREVFVPRKMKVKN